MGVTVYSEGRKETEANLTLQENKETNFETLRNNTNSTFDASDSSSDSESEISEDLSHSQELDQMQNVNSYFLNLFECNANLSKTVNITLPIQQEDEHKTLTFLVDTGSDISAIKHSQLPNPQKIDPAGAIPISGIAHVPIFSLGTCEIQLNINNIQVEQTFHVLKDNINLRPDGIIGNDFLRTHKVQINYHDYTLYLKGQTLPLGNPFQENQEQPIILNPRTETVMQVKIANPEMKEGIISKVSIQDGVYLASSIVKVNPDSHALTTILNTTDHTVKLPDFQIRLEPMENFKTNQNKGNAYKMNQVNTLSINGRLNVLKSTLRLDHLSDEERNSIIEICQNYHSIFYLPGDTLPETSIIEHEIKTTDNTPIQAKSYRYPHAHKEEVHRQIENMLEQGIISHSNSPWSAPIWVVPKKKDASGKTKWRVVVDYRALNNKTIQDSFPLPNITDILDQLGNSKYFSCLDCYSGFHSVKIKEEDAPKTAFSTDVGHYHFNRMPFGLKNSPATYSRLMNTIFSGLQGSRVFLYMDDVVIHGSNLDDHNKKLKEVFERLKTSNLKLQPDKCEFLRKEVIFLGHKITEDGVKPNPDKVKAVKCYPVPKNAKDIQAFLGLCNYYRRFIHNFAAIAKPLTDLTKKNIPFQWQDTQQNAFEILKQKLCSEPILKYPNFEEPFILTTDASDYAISGILSQGEIPSDLPISYASRILNQAEKNYSCIEKELLAIVWSVRYYRPYLYGKHFTIYTDHKPLIYLFNVKDPGSRLIRWRLKLEEYSYTIKYKPGKHNTNADSLSRAIPIESNKESNCFVNTPSPDSQPSYNDFLKEIDSKVIINPNINETRDSIQKTKDNLAIPISEDSLENPNLLLSDILKTTNHTDSLKTNKPSLGNVLILPHNNRYILYFVTKKFAQDRTNYLDLFETLKTLKEIMIARNIDSISFPKIGKQDFPQFRAMLRFIFRDTTIKINIHHHTQTTPKPEDILKILEENHSLPHSGHFGFQKTYEKVKSKFYWPSMKDDIHRYVQTCPSCQENKLVRKKNKEPMVITDTSEEAFNKVALDIVGPLNLTESGNKYLLTIQDNLTKFSQAFPIPNQEAETVARTFVNEFVCKFSLPQKILTDQGSNFTSNLFKSVAKLFKMKHIQTTAYHPESNGGLERSHHTLVEYLKHYINQKQTNWDEWIPMATFAYNTTVHSSTKFTPYELVFGMQPKLPTSLTQTPEFHYTYDDYAQDLKMKLNKSFEIARNNIQQSKETNKKYYDKNSSHTVYKVGDLVYLLNETSIPSTSRKLNPAYTGPYEIISVDSPVNVTLRIKRRLVKVHTNRIKIAFVSEDH